jgi:hypothetical protein
LMSLPAAVLGQFIKESGSLPWDASQHQVFYPAPFGFRCWISDDLYMRPVREFSKSLFGIENKCFCTIF